MPATPENLAKIKLEVEGSETVRCEGAIPHGRPAAARRERQDGSRGPVQGHLEQLQAGTGVRRLARGASVPRLILSARLVEVSVADGGLLRATMLDSP